MLWREGRLMTEAEWLTSKVAYQPLIHIRQFASIRRLRLLAAAYVRWLEECPGYQDAKRCADLIEKQADAPRPGAELEMLLQARGGDWRLAHALGPDDLVGQQVNKLVWVAENSFRGQQADPGIPHARMFELLRDIFGNPFRPFHFSPEWRTDTAVALARQIYDARDFSLMSILADALQDAGCENEDILDHCRGPGPHVRGCWVVDLVLGKE